MNEVAPQAEATCEYEWRQTPELREWLTNRDRDAALEQLACPALGPEDASDALDQTFIAALDAQRAAQSDPDNEELQEQARIMARVAVHHGSKLKYVFNKHDSKKQYISPAQHKVNQIITTLDSAENDTALRDAVIAYYQTAFKPATEQTKVTTLDIIKRTVTDNPTVRHGIAAAAVIGGISAAGMASAAPAAAAEPIVSHIYPDQPNISTNSLDDVVTIVTNPAHQPAAEKVRASMDEDNLVNILPTPVEKIAASPETPAKPIDGDTVVTIPPDVVKKPEVVTIPPAAITPPTPSEAAPTPAPNVVPQPTTPETPAANELIQAAQDMAKQGGVWERRGVAMQFFIEHGLTPAQAAGLVGNLLGESGEEMNPGQNQHGGPAFGIAQWEAGRLANLRAFAGDKVDDFRVQLEFIWHELTGSEANALTALKSTTTRVQAAVAVRAMYERPSVHRDEDRIAYANQVADNYNEKIKAIRTAQQQSQPKPIEQTVADMQNVGWPTTGEAAMRLFNQCDPRWGNIKSPLGLRVCNIACGPTSVAMAIDALTGQTVTPKEVIDYTNANELWLPGDQGTSFQAAINLGVHWGIRGREMTNFKNIDAYRQILKNGGMILVAGTGATPFVAPKDGAHFVLIRGMTSDGKFLVADPYPKTGDTNTVAWDANQMMHDTFGAVAFTK